MPSANVYDMDGAVVREFELDPYVFGAPVNVGMLHQVVTAQLVNRRQGNANTKTRAEVSGGNSKPYRQKGTGHARQGSTRAPQFRHGGSVFGPRAHPYERSIPRKIKRLAIRQALSDKVATGHLLLMDGLTFEEPRTKDMEALLASLPIERKVLLLMPERDENVVLSARNLYNIKTDHVSAINVVEILKYDHLLMPVATVEKIVTMFGQDADDALQMKRHPRVVLRRKARRAASAAQTEAGATAATASKPATSATTKTSARAAKTPKAETPAATDATDTTSAPETGGTTKRARGRTEEK